LTLNPQPNIFFEKFFFFLLFLGTTFKKLQGTTTLVSKENTHLESMGSLPWPRGAPPKFQGSAIQKDAQHWKVGDYVRCAQCGSRTHCEHKSLHAKNLNAKWEEMAEGHDNRPEFFFEGKKWLQQIKQHPELRIGDPLPPGVPRGWESNPGNSEVVIGSPRRHGEWRLVWQQRDTATVNHVDVPTKRSRSTNPVAQKQMHARKEWEESRVPILVDRHALRSVSMTPGTHLAPRQ
jgi:hypothetical protein